MKFILFFVVSFYLSHFSASIHEEEINIKQLAISPKAEVALEELEIDQQDCPLLQLPQEMLFEIFQAIFNTDATRLFKLKITCHSLNNEIKNFIDENFKDRNKTCFQIYCFHLTFDQYLSSPDNLFSKIKITTWDKDRFDDFMKKAYQNPNLKDLDISEVFKPGNHGVNFWKNFKIFFKFAVNQIENLNLNHIFESSFDGTRTTLIMPGSHLSELSHFFNELTEILSKNKTLKTLNLDDNGIEKRDILSFAFHDIYPIIEIITFQNNYFTINILDEELVRLNRHDNGWDNLISNLLNKNPNLILDLRNSTKCTFGEYDGGLFEDKETIKTLLKTGQFLYSYKTYVKSKNTDFNFYKNSL